MNNIHARFFYDSITIREMSMHFYIMLYAIMLFTSYCQLDRYCLENNKHIAGM